MNASGVSSSGSSSIVRPPFSASRAPERDARREEVALPRLRPDGVAEARLVVALLEPVAARLLVVGRRRSEVPRRSRARRRRSRRRAPGRPEDAEAAALRALDQVVERVWRDDRCVPGLHASRLARYGARSHPCEPGGTLAGWASRSSAASSACSAKKTPSEKVGYGWIVSRSVSSGTAARIASVSWPSHSAACGPTQTAPTRTSCPRIGEEAQEARPRRLLVRREPRHRVELDARRDEAVAVGPPHRRDLGIGEDAGGDRAVVGPRALPAEIGGGDARLVLPDVREERDAVDVADRPHVVGRAQPVVDGDPAGRDLDAELLEAEPFDVRAPPGRDEQPPALDLGAVGEMDADPRLDLLDADADAHVDARPRETRPPATRPRRSGSARAAPRRARRSSPSRPSARRTARARSRPGRRRARRGSRVPGACVSPRGSSSTRPRRCRRREGSPAATRSRRRACRTGSPRRRPRRRRAARPARRRARAGSSSPRGSGAGRSRPSRSSSSRATTTRRPDRASAGRVPARGRATPRARSPAASSSSACTRSTSTRRRRADSRRA